MIDRRTLLKLLAAAGTVTTTTLLAAGAHAADPVKAGFIYVSPVGDAGWTFQHDQGRKEMEKALAGKATTKFVESVPEGAALGDDASLGRVLHEDNERGRFGQVEAVEHLGRNEGRDDQGRCLQRRGSR